MSMSMRLSEGPLTDIKKGVSRVYWTKQPRFRFLSWTWPVNTMENQYPPAIYGIIAYGGISAWKGENVAAVLRCKARFPQRKLVCASKPWRLCVVRTGHHRAYISRKPRTKSSKNSNGPLSSTNFYFEATIRPLPAGKCPAWSIFRVPL